MIRPYTAAVGMAAPLKITLLLTLQRSLSRRACRGLGQRNMWPSEGDRRGSAETHFNNHWRICSAQSLCGGAGGLWVAVDCL